MRFRAKTTSKDLIELFIQVSVTVGRLAKVCVLRVSEDKLCFSPPGPLTTSEAQMWCEVRRGVFCQFHMQGVSEELREIYLELKADLLSRAARSAVKATSLKLQLTNKHCPCLTLSVEVVSVSGSIRKAVHDIPVRVLPTRWWAECPEPVIRATAMSVCLPALKTLKSIVEKMAHMSNHVLVEANWNGRMNLSVETDTVSVKSHFKNLENPSKSAVDRPRDEDAESMVQVRVDSRKLLQFFEGQQIHPTRVLCNILSNALHLVLAHENVSLQYFIPAS
ncbi:checkpoint protein HUS1B [Perognathus longimembris pacificus]|uniref:checkpoint protein HUS1B n=1 Tax=Perognathus longimembris pacificus TaxID=214514 RepID=UPI002019992A|nr:checkpoint protein HUS1B [Perognathus longimembris pacificus]